MAWAYIIFGAVAMILELFVPGGVVFCLGLSALCTGALLLAGVLEGMSLSFMVCCVLSVVFVVPAQFLLKRFSDGDISVADTDEDAECFGQEVVVTEMLEDVEAKGRIKFQGTEWPAMSHGGSLAVGARARIIGRENLVWVVEEIPSLEKT